MCFLKCTLQEGVPEFPLYNIKGKHGEMDADMDADAAPWRYASLSRILQGPLPSMASGPRLLLSSAPPRVKCQVDFDPV